jgi:hypothetical protein
MSLRVALRFWGTSRCETGVHRGIREARTFDPTAVTVDRSEPMVRPALPQAEGDEVVALLRREGWGMWNGSTSRVLGAVTLVLAVIAALVAMTVPALAHNPLIEADPVCLEDGSIVVNYTAWSWLQDPNDDARSGNPNIGIYADGTKVDQGVFVTPDYQFFGSFPWPGGDSIVVMARADAPFNNGSSQGSFRETTVGRPPCETTTTTTTTTTTLPPPPPTGAIGDLVWEDTNADGHQGDFEPGMAAVEVNLLSSAGTIIGSTVTDATGNYRFAGLSAGTYEVQFTLPEGFELSPLRAAAPAVDSDAGAAGRTGPITLASGETDLTWDAGIYRIPEVLPQVVTTTTTSPPPETLPFTGPNEGALGGIGLVLLALGSMVLSVGRRREEQTEVMSGWSARLERGKG